MNLKIKQKFVAIIMFLIIASPIALISNSVIAAYEDPLDTNYGLDKLTGIQVSKTSDFHGTIARVINIALGFLGVIAVVIILYAGFKWMTAGGKEENVKDAKKMIVEAVIGLVIIFLAWAIANFVISQLADATDVR